MELDESAKHAAPDRQTVTPAGETVTLTIDGVIVLAPMMHVDHRGRLFEFFSGVNYFWVDPVVFGHISSIRPNCVKGWGLHRHKNDRYTLVSGEVLVALWDARLDSPTHGLVQRVYLAPDSVRQVLIPAGVWHAAINLGMDEAFIINMPTQPYDYASPDKVRLSARSPVAPVDLADFFPSQFDSSREREC
jgi:dTDP-4-dehydrorhamnose 3,5-epimerase